MTIDPRWLLLTLLLIGGSATGCAAWMLTSTTNTARSIWNRGILRRCSVSSSTSLQDASEGEQESEVDFKRRMSLVRSLQTSYYKSTSFVHPSVDPTTGIITDLPLWRVGWTELPGRSNMLNVHEPIYTNLFESIFHNENDKPWYIGHLYLPQGSANLKKKHTTIDATRPYQLKTWDEEIADTSRNDNANATCDAPRSAVVGTLMRIADYRRMLDGRLLVLVEAMERFVVTNIKQEVPYSIADVQLLPDTEEVDPDFRWVADSTEGDVRDARSLALQESFQRYHPYEYDETFQLPIDKKNDLKSTDIYGSMLMLVVPYVPLSKTADLAQLNNRPLDFEKRDTCGGDDKEETAKTVEIWDDGQDHYAHVTDEQPCLEQQLLQGGILKGFEHPDESVMNLSFEDLEYRVWMEINNFLKSTRTPVSPVLLGLLPPNVEWPSNFYLRKIADDIASRTDLKHNFVPVSPLLPLHRRLRRLSYSATTLVEHKPGMERLRQRLLETVSTKARLALILDTLEEYNSVSVWGEYE